MKKFIKKIIVSSSFFPIVIFLFTFAVYAHNLSPGVYLSDSGDFLSAIISKGVAHPSGYPLYTMLGILFLYIPINATVAYKVGLISVLASSLALVIFYKISYKLGGSKLFAFISSLMLAFTYPFWFNAVITEIFALHNLFLVSIFYLILKLYDEFDYKDLYIFSFISGLALTNNLKIVLIFPITAVFLILRKKFRAGLTINNIIKSISLFFLGLTPYLYIPFAAFRDPVVNWNRPVNLENFLHLLLRRDYGWGTESFSGFEFTNPINTYLVYWQNYISPLFIILSVIGTISLLYNKKFGYVAYTSSVFLFVGIFFFVYSRTNITSLYHLATIERFFLSSIIVFGFMMAAGMGFVTQLLQNAVSAPLLKKFIFSATILAFIVIPVGLFISNYSKTDHRDFYFIDDLAKSIIDPLPENSYIIFTSDTYAFPVFYMQLAYDYRTDVVTSGKNVGWEKFLVDSGLFDHKDAKDYMIANQNTAEAEKIQEGIAILVHQGKYVFSEKPISYQLEGFSNLIPVPYGMLYKIIKEEDKPSHEQYMSDYLDSFDYIINYSATDRKHDLLISENLNYTHAKLHYANKLQIVSAYIKDEYNDFDTAIQLLIQSFQIIPEMVTLVE